MSDTPVIDKFPDLKPSQDFAALRQAGLDYIQALSRRWWTDYNVHDPGITILDVLCYAITDLGYRTDYDVADLLTREHRGVPENVGAFHTARAVFPTAPVTFMDLRKRLVDIRGVRNAWVAPHRSVVYGLDRGAETLAHPDASEAETLPPLNGLYDVFVEYEDFVEDHRDAKVGRPIPEVDPEEAASYIAPQGRGQAVRVERDLTLASVTVFARPASEGADGPLAVALTLEDADGTPLETVQAEIPWPPASETASFVRACIPIDIPLTAGRTYRLTASSSGARLLREPEGGYPYAVDGVLTLTSGVQGGLELAPYYFFYDWTVRYAITGDALLTAARVTRDDVQAEARRRLHADRRLGEDLVNLCEMSTEEVAVCADFDVEPSADIDAITAAAFARLEQHVSPPARFYTIDELKARGKTADEIFEGPLLDHGFLDPDEFAAREERCRVRASDVIQILMDLDGVTAVRQVTLLSFVDGAVRARDEWVLELSDDPRRAPSFAPDRSRFLFYKRELPYYPNRERVATLLAERRARDVASRLRGHQDDLPVPTGEDKALRDYYPVQNELPATYQVGLRRVPENASAQRKAQSRQLKAYLLFFEQLLANYLAQLAHLDVLFSWTSTDERTYASQEVRDIAEIDALYLSRPVHTDGAGWDLQAELDAIAEDAPTRRDRRRRFQEHLLARLGEQFVDYSLLLLAQDDERGAQRVLADQRAFLADAPALSRESGQGFDYCTTERPYASTGYQRRVERLIGVRRLARRGDRFRITRTDAGWRFVLVAPPGAEVWFESEVVPTRTEAEDLLDRAAEDGPVRSRYTAVPETDGEYELSQGPGGPQPGTAIGRTTGPGTLDRTIAAFQAVAIQGGFRPAAPPLTTTRIAIRRADDPDAVRPWFFVVTAPDGRVLFESIHCDEREAVEALLDDVAALGADHRNYETYTPDLGPPYFALVRRCDDATVDPVGRLDPADLDPVVGTFLAVADAEGLHVLEHVLLRPRTAGDPFLPVQLNAPGDCRCIEVRDPYSFRITVLLPAWPERMQDIKFRQFVEETIRLEAPAHLYLRICWVGLAQMAELEAVYHPWRAQLHALCDVLGICCAAGDPEGHSPPCSDADVVAARTAGPRYDLCQETRSGAHPLPEAGAGERPDALARDHAFRAATQDLIDVLYDLDTVYPLARLHDCESTRSDTPQVTLNFTKLGTL
jgi:hypothetical protein